MDSGVRMAIDVGTVRIGVAASDPAGTMAFPVATVPRDAASVPAVAALIEERGATHVFVGLPRTLSGGEGKSAADARAFASELAERTPAAVRLIDERFSTASASRQLHAAGRTTRGQRQVIDQAAAVVILEQALDTERQGNLGTVAVEVARKGSHD